MERIPITFKTLIQHRYKEETNYPIEVDVDKREATPSARVFINRAFGEAVIYDTQDGITGFRTNRTSYIKVEYMDEIIKWYIYKTKSQLPEYIKKGFMYVSPLGFRCFRTISSMEAQGQGFTKMILKIDPNSDKNCFLFNANGICLGFKGESSLIYDSTNHVEPATKEEYDNAIWNDKLQMLLIKDI
jgi:hypothetical protein